MLRRFAVAALCASALLARVPAPPRLRLPAAARPVSYDVDLTIVPGAETFQGSIVIAIDFLEPTKLLWLNATELHIVSARLDRAGRSRAVRVVPGGGQFAGFAFDAAVTGHAVLHAAYTGRLSRTSSAGVFEMREDGHWYVYTQFEPSDARRAFPCFDEPSYKAIWRMTLHVPREDLALANTPQTSETGEPGERKRVTFAPTQPLASYLAAFAVGPFEAVSAGRLGRTPLRVIVPKGHAAEAAFAVEAIPQLLDLLEKYFGTPYPFEKLDSIAMPVSDFAMENAGLITYGQSLLLASESGDTILRRREFAVTAAHEMAHQWFGDEVTTPWWDDIWLNEAFATWMERKITGEWKPAWDLDVRRISESQGAMGLDSLVSARRIREPIASNDDIANAFDGITYQKGAAVISMFENWIGPEIFRRGVEGYLARYRGGNATTAQFLAAIGEAAGKDVVPAFNSFLDQAGVPLVRVALDCSGGAPRIALSQSRFLPPGAPPSPAAMWRIPVCVRYATGDGTAAECELLDAPRAEFPLKAARGCPAWMLANSGEYGYYRVAYQGGLLSQTLADAGAHLTLGERVGELENLEALAEAGQAPVAEALGQVRVFRGAPERQVVEAAAGIASILKSRAVAGDLRPAASRFIRDAFGSRAEALGWKARPGDDDDTKLLRQELVPFVASEGDDRPLAAGARELAARWLDDRSAIDPNMESSVLTTAAEFGDRALFDRFLAAVRSAKARGTREHLFEALGSFRDPAIAAKALDLLLTGEFDAREAFDALLFGPLRYPETRAMPFEFVTKHADELAAKIPREVGEDFAASLPFTGGAFCGAARREEVRAFFAPRAAHYTGGPRNLAQTLEEIDDCSARRAALAPGLTAFLRSY